MSAACGKCKAGRSALQLSTDTRADGSRVQAITCRLCGWTIERNIRWEVDAVATKNTNKVVAECLECKRMMTICSRRLCGRCWSKHKKAGTLDAKYPAGSNATLPVETTAGELLESVEGQVRAEKDFASKQEHLVTPGSAPGLVDIGQINIRAGADSLDPFDVQIGGDHYKDMAIQPLEFICANKIPFPEGSVIKYVCRHKHKGGAQDIRKAIHLLQVVLKAEYGATE
jgi:hypothetical protein